MSISAVNSTAHAAASTTKGLVKTDNGEVTAASVAENPGLAVKLIKLKNGNYAYPIVSAADRAGGIGEALTTLKLGG